MEGYDFFTKNVLITGGSRGIGAETVRLFCEKGANVVFFYNKSETAAMLIEEDTRAKGIRCDVGCDESVKEAMAEAKKIFDGPIDVLVCNAGISDFNLVTDIGAERWNRIMDVNLNGAYYCIKEALPEMISAKKGCIITVSSMWGQVGASCEVAYSASKAGLIGMTKALAKELGPSHIRVNCVAPGMIDTDMNATLSYDDVKALEEETPLMRSGYPLEVAELITFLASDKADFITGQVVGINGGFVV